MFLPAPHFTGLTGIRLVDTKQGYVTGATTITLPANRSDVLVIAYLVGGYETDTVAPSLADFTYLSGSASLPSPSFGTSDQDEPRRLWGYAWGPGNTKILNPQSGTRNAAYIIRSYLGVNQSSPFSTAFTGGSSSTASVPNPPSITPAHDNSLILILGSVINTTVDTGWGAPTNYSNLVVQSAGDSSGQNAVAMMAERLLPTAAAEDPGAFTHASVTGGWASNTIALRPA